MIPEYLCFSAIDKQGYLCLYDDNLKIFYSFNLFETERFLDKKKYRYF